MAKFKVGDRVRVKRTCSGCRAGETYVVEDTFRDGSKVPLGDGGLCARNETVTANCGCSCQKDWELIQPTYTRIEPKVGQRYRVLKKFGDSYIFGKDGGEATGHIIEYTCGSLFKPVGFTFGNNRQDEQIISSQKYLTTEYLELVEEETITIQGLKCVIKPASEIFNQPSFTKQPITTKIMNRIKKALLNKEDKTLIEAGYLDENLNLTCEGKGALQFINFTAAKKEMVAMAQTDLDEQKKD